MLRCSWAAPVAAPPACCSRGVRDCATLDGAGSWSRSSCVELARRRDKSATPTQVSDYRSGQSTPTVMAVMERAARAAGRRSRLCCMLIKFIVDLSSCAEYEGS